MSGEHSLATQLASAKQGHIRDNLSSGVSNEGVSQGVKDMQAANDNQSVGNDEHSQATQMKKQRGDKQQASQESTDAQQGNSVGVMVILGLGLCIIRDAVQITLALLMFVPLIGFVTTAIGAVPVIIMSIFCLLSFVMDIKFMTFIATNVLGLTTGTKGKVVKEVGKAVSKKLITVLGESLAPIVALVILVFPFYTVFAWILIGKYRAAPPEDTNIKKLAVKTVKAKATPQKAA